MENLLDLEDNLILVKNRIMLLEDMFGATNFEICEEAVNGLWQFLNETVGLLNEAISFVDETREQAGAAEN